MSTALLILLLGAVRWTASHVLYGKEPPRLTRNPYDEWRPVREGAAVERHVPYVASQSRYPVFHHNKGYSYAPAKKIVSQQLAESSDTVEVFSPAPPSILGSLSLFGHATVNAREPASHVTKKSPRPQYTADYPLYERPKLNSYQIRNPFATSNYYQQSEAQKKPNRFTEYNDALIYDSTLRPPQRDSINKVYSYSPHSQSLPNSFYFEQPQPFQPSAVDNSFEKIRQPIHSYHFSTTPGYSTPGTVDYRTTINDYNHPEGPPFAPTSKKSSHHSSSWNKNLYENIGLNTKRPGTQIKPVVEEKELAKDIYEQYSHLSRPFQNSQYTTIDSPREVETYSPYVTTYASPVETHNVKFSDVAQPFQVNNDYRTQGVSVNKPEYVVTQDPYSQDEYQMTVTTMNVPTETEPETKKTRTEVYKGDSYLPEPSKRPFSKNKNSFDSYANQRPQVQITSYQGFNNNVLPPFLPTPNPDAYPYAPLPTMEDETTDQPEVSSNAQDFNYISTVDNKYQNTNEETTDYPATTTTAVETTTTPSPRTRATIKSRRRPTRPSGMSKASEGSKYKNHRIPEDEVSTTVDYYKHQRRRKPSNKYRDNSEYKRFRTTSTSTTTTTAQPLYDTTEPYEDLTTISEAPMIVGQNTADRPLESDYNHFNHFYSSFNPDREVPVENLFSSQSPDRELYNLNYADIFAETTASSISSTTPTTTSTTTTTTTPAPTTASSTTKESLSSTPPSRMKNKYGSNRPRFSVKDYRERLTRGSSTTPTSVSNESVTTPKPKSDIPKILSRMRPSLQLKQPIVESTQGEETTPEPKYRKYKPRLGPSRTFYKTSTTSSPSEVADTTTTERVNTFRPSTNRYKPGTGKYYSRYRTSTISLKDTEDSPATTTPKITIKPKGVFSAKRRPYVTKNRPDSNREENDSEEEGASTPNFGDTLKVNDNEVLPGIMTKKMDDGPTTTMSSSEERDVVGLVLPTSASNLMPSLPPSGNEAMRVADLTSSSSNDFQSSTFLKTNAMTNKRILPKITFPSEEPILPLEAFFQTRHKNQ